VATSASKRRTRATPRARACCSRTCRALPAPRPTRPPRQVALCLPVAVLPACLLRALSTAGAPAPKRVRAAAPSNARPRTPCVWRALEVMAGAGSGGGGKAGAREVESLGGGEAAVAEQKERKAEEASIRQGLEHSTQVRVRARARARARGGVGVGTCWLYRCCCCLCLCLCRARRSSGRVR
jgi:hypothetical protein